MPLSKLVYQLTVRTTVQAIAGWSMCLGAGTAWGGDARFGSPALQTARLVPGGVYAWAALIFAGGALTLAGSVLHWRRRVVMTGLMWMGLWFGFFDVCLWTSLATEPRASITGCFTYGLLATVCAILYSGGHGLVAVQHAEEDPQQ